MKKILLLIMSMCLVLCGCEEKKEEIKVEIPFQKVAACNNRVKLLEKYGYISERTASREKSNDDFSYWTMYYEKTNDSINAILDYSAEYKCYYLNNEIFTEYGDGEVRKVLPYRENYDKIISGLLARTDTLSYVFITNSEAVETEEGFEVSYEFIVNNDILPELEGLGVDVGTRVLVEYELDKDYIIQRCKYKRLDGEKETEVARIDITYGKKKTFPESVTRQLSVKDDEWVYINIIENFGTGAEYRETHKVKKGSFVTENDALLNSYLFKDPLYREVFDTSTEKIEKDTNIFIIDISYADYLFSKDEYIENEKVEEESEIVSEM